MERLRLGLLNLKEDGSVVSTGDKVHEVDRCRVIEFFVVPLVSFPCRGKVYLLGDCVPSSAPQNSFLSKMHTLGQALCPKLGKNVHLGPQASCSLFSQWRLSGIN